MYEQMVPSASVKKVEKKEESKNGLDPRTYNFCGQTWSQVIDKVCVGRNRDKIVEAKRKEVMEKFDINEFFSWLSQQLPDDYEREEVIDDPRYLKGFVFEYLVNREINDDEENGYIGEFIIQCLKNPQMIGLNKWAMRNPDHLGVQVDAEKGEAYITGMYEVKMGKLTERARDQVRDFYGNLEKVIGQINSNIKELREKSHLLPPQGIVLKKFDEIYKFIVSPLPERDEELRAFQDKENELKEKGWGLRKSVFTYGSMDYLAVRLSDYYDALKEANEELAN